MLMIDENSVYSKRKIENFLNRYTRGYYTLKKDSIIADMDRFHGMYLAEKDKVTKKGYRDVIDYLALLEDNMVNDYIKAFWTVENDALIAKPFKFKAMRDLGIDTINYVIKRDDKTVVISYKELWDLLALQIAHRDLDFNTKDIDKKLIENGYSLSSIYGTSGLFDITMHNAYDEAIGLKIGDTQYTDISKSNGKQYINYFGKVIDTEYYRDVIQSSIDTAMLMILTHCLDKVKRNCSIEFMGIIDDRIYFNTDMSNSELEDSIIDRILVRAFGRYFEIQPKVELY